MQEGAAVRCFRGAGDGFDLADDDAVVAGVVYGGGAALQGGQGHPRPLQQLLAPAVPECLLGG